MPDCPFEVSTTNRYTILEHEASVTARKLIGKGEIIKYLSGVQVPLTSEEESMLNGTRNDFSIVLSSRKRSTSLFLGPARFANHDCNANARLSTTGYSGMQVIATRPIRIGEEITVSYGDDYFGSSNRECLCGTCEKLMRNGWSATNDMIDQVSSERSEASSTSSSLHLKRKRPNSRKVSLWIVSKPTEILSTILSKKGKFLIPPECQSPTLKRKRGRPPSAKTLFLRHLLQSGPTDLAGGDVLPPLAMAQPSTEGPSSSLPSLHEESDDIQDHSDNLVGEAEYGPRQVKTHSTENLDSGGGDGAAPVDETGLPSPRLTEYSGTPQVEIPLLPSLQAEVNSTSELSELPEDMHLDDNLMQIISRPPDPLKNKLAALAALKLGQRISRTPNDWTLTPLLLLEKGSRWVRCRNCQADFVQPNAHQTRMACPRCERHSKLYGYAWPKTEKEGSHDTEDRIIDHRQLHRYVWPDEERKIKKARLPSLKADLLNRTREQEEIEARPANSMYGLRSKRRGSVPS